MKPIFFRLSIVVVTLILVILLYGVAPIRFLSFDFFKRVNASLFNTFKVPNKVDDRIILLNTGTKSIEEIRAYIELLKKYNPKVIGVNLCNLATGTESIKSQYKTDTQVIFVNCEKNNHTLGRIINDDNSVTHFQSDNYQSFERRVLNNTTNPDSKVERINYSKGGFYKYELDSTEFIFDIFPNSIIMLGYLGDYLNEVDPFDTQSELRYFTNARITPLNRYFSLEDASPDMYDTEISAQIVSCLLDQNFIKDVSKLTSVAILLAFILFQTLVMSLVQNKNILISIGVGLLSYFLIKMAGSFLIVYLFTEGYYLQLHELMLLLVVVIVFNLGFNVFKKTSKAPTPSS
ncbi:MAG: hypothetical protein E6Q41_01190 [Cyclobacteriaceae bacterium]|nr:MAG: hypothetical protein E6Q41_01190 [Cyclobacteriaceae bacterium]